MMGLRWYNCMYLLAKNEAKKQMITILFLTSNPHDTNHLAIDEEVRAIDERLRRASFREVFGFKSHWAVRVSDLQELFLRYKPTIVHFSGHGSTSSEIILQDDLGTTRAIPPQALSNLFSIFQNDIRCVVLNACYSNRQAKAIAKNIDCVIGMTDTITDVAARSFSSAFYQALGYGQSVKTAFDLGCGQIHMEELGNIMFLYYCLLESIPIVLLSGLPRTRVFSKE